VAAYGSVEGIVDESAPLLGDLGPYSAAKARADAIVIACGRAVLLRPGIVYGPGSVQWSDRIRRLLVSRRLGDLGAAGDGCCNLVFIDDMTAAVLSALRAPAIEGQAFNLSLPSPPTWNEYFIRFAKELGAVPVRRITRRRLAIETKLLAPPLKILEILAARGGLDATRVPPAIPPSLLRLFRQELYLQSTKAQSILGMNWTPLEEGLRQTTRNG
jgi:nucleoside-diphosphate-sugar epimerase